jgi:fibronectin type 3 domain-containing protein
MFLAAIVFALVGSAHSVALKWNWIESGNPATGFHVQRSTSPTGGFSRIAVVPVTQRTYTDAGVAAGKTYYYRVLAYNAAGNSEPSNVLKEVIP